MRNAFPTLQQTYRNYIINPTGYPDPHSVIQRHMCILLFKSYSLRIHMKFINYCYPIYWMWLFLYEIFRQLCDWSHPNRAVWTHNACGQRKYVLAKMKQSSLVYFNPDNGGWNRCEKLNRNCSCIRKNRSSIKWNCSRSHARTQLFQCIEGLLKHPCFRNNGTKHHETIQNECKSSRKTWKIFFIEALAPRLL